MTTIAITARCVHCTWNSDHEPGRELDEIRSIHELIHPGGTVLVGDDDHEEKRGTPVIQTHEVRASERWKPSPAANGGRRPRGYWTPERCIEALQTFAREHGRAPKQEELRSPLPSNQILIRCFGNMTKAIAAAGLDPAGRGSRGRGRPAPPPVEPDPVPPPEPEPAPPIVANDGRSLVDLARDVERASQAVRDAETALETARTQLRQALEALGEQLTEVQEAA